ncbi:hypothetical protein [Pontibacter qinzhouensis]|uniref:hypothetical protein n=1 Tax=Pontibacter qinzhouensis TaxID=2603253 RepID=UPI00164FA320|nr:hypothetical protein [Pontibacter qinzhouensis]
MNRGLFTFYTNTETTDYVFITATSGTTAKSVGAKAMHVPAITETPHYFVPLWHI